MTSVKKLIDATSDEFLMADPEQPVEDRVSPHIPPEILQTIFRNLEFFDLIRCQRVCRTWHAYLPGDDAELHRILFSEADYGDAEEIEENEETDEEEDQDTEDDTDSSDEDDSSDSEESVENEREEDGTSPTNLEDHGGIPRIIISLKAPVDFISIDGQLPRLSFVLEIEFNSAHEIDFDGVTNFDSDAVFHPMVADLDTFMHLVNPHFSVPHEDGAGNYEGSVFSFTSFEELGQKTRMPKGHGYNDGSWKNMLICVPAVEQVRIEFKWPHAGYDRQYTTTFRESRGVTVGQFVSRVRRMLGHVEEDVRDFSGSMAVYCNDCGEMKDADMWR